MPYLSSRLNIGTVELNLVEETAFKCPVHIILQVGGGNEDSIEVLHLLKDNILNSVLALVGSGIMY